MTDFFMADHNRAIYLLIYSYMRKLQRLENYLDNFGKDDVFLQSYTEILNYLLLWAKLYPAFYNAALTTFNFHSMPADLIENIIQVPDTDGDIAQFTYDALRFISETSRRYKELYRRDIVYLRRIILTLYGVNRWAVIIGIQRYKDLNCDDISLEYREFLQKQATIHLINRQSVN